LEMLYKLAQVYAEEKSKHNTTNSQIFNVHYPQTQTEQNMNWWKEWLMPYFNDNIPLYTIL
jgi:hypothetical protein